MRAFLLAGWLLAFVSCAQAEGLSLRLGPAAGSMPIGASTAVPYGWVDFCQRRASECETPALPPRLISMNAANAAIIARIDREVNAEIQPVTNLDHWGTVLDHWDYLVDGKGDCKIYAIEKRRRLMALGFPRQALLLTIVHDLEGAGHTILTVVTDRGDVILDNLTEAIRPWQATGYEYVKQQSQEDPNVWLAIDAAAPRVALGRDALEAEGEGRSVSP